jgi:molecular chaperone DnaJ
MARAKDLYEILGVPRNATQDEIRRAYLKLAHKYHPDKTGGDKEAEEKLKEINAAYDILKNPEKRAQYDRFGTVDGQPFGEDVFSGFGGFGSFESAFDDLFSVFFGSGSTRSRGPRVEPGADVEMIVTLTLEEAAFGIKRRVRFRREEQCEECKGTGSLHGRAKERCSRCNGTGQIRLSHGLFTIAQTCSACRGEGRIISHACTACGGTGTRTVERELEVNIPAGVDTGSRIRVSGEGGVGRNGGPRGDLYLQVRMERHPFFEREGIHLRCEVPISITTAALGGTITVPTLSGTVELRIPPGTQSGQEFVVKGHGLPDLRGYRQGDLWVRIRVEVPSKLSKRQRELLQEFEALADARTYPDTDDFRRRVLRER